MKRRWTVTDMMWAFMMGIADGSTKRERERLVLECGRGESEDERVGMMADGEEVVDDAWTHATHTAMASPNATSCSPLTLKPGTGPTVCGTPLPATRHGNIHL